MLVRYFSAKASCGNRSTHSLLCLKWVSEWVSWWAESPYCPYHRFFCGLSESNQGRSFLLFSWSEPKPFSISEFWVQAEMNVCAEGSFWVTALFPILKRCCSSWTPRQLPAATVRERKPQEVTMQSAIFCLACRRPQKSTFLRKVWRQCEWAS